MRTILVDTCMGQVRATEVRTDYWIMTIAGEDLTYLGWESEVRSYVARQAERLGKPPA